MHRKKNPCFVVRPEQGHQRGVRPDRPSEPVQIQQPGGIHREPGDLVSALGQVLAKFDRRRVLDRRRDDVLFVRVKRERRRDRRVDRFRPAARENDLVLPATRQGGHLRAGFLQDLRGLPPERIHARRIPVTVPQQRHHDLQNLRRKFRRGVVVEVDNRFHGNSEIYLPPAGLAIPASFPLLNPDFSF